MKTAAVDKSAGGGDTPAPRPGNSLPRSSAKTPFIWDLGKKEQLWERRGEGSEIDRAEGRQWLKKKHIFNEEEEKSIVERRGPEKRKVAK